MALRMLSDDLLEMTFDYLHSLECRRAAYVSTTWHRLLESRYMDLGHTIHYNPDDAMHALFDQWDLKPPLYVSSSLVVWSSLWQHRGIRERLASIRGLYLNIFGYHGMHENGNAMACEFPPFLRRCVLEGPMTHELNLSPILCIEKPLPSLEEVMVNGEIHERDLIDLFGHSVRLQLLHLRDVRPQTTLRALPRLRLDRLRCLHIVNPNARDSE